MNGVPSAALPKLEIPIGNPEVIAVLEQLLGQARAGRVAAVGVVMVAGPGSVQAVASGGLMLEVNLGCDMLKRAVLDSVSGKRSPILRAG